MNIARKSMCITITLLLSMLSPVLTHASCVQADVTGTWYTHSMSVDSAGNLAARTYRCKVKVNSSGSIVGSKSSCNVRDRTGQFSVGISGGSIKTSSKCNLRGAVRLSSGLGVVDMDSGKLSRDKLIFSLTGHDRDRPGYLTHLTAVKQ